MFFMSLMITFNTSSKETAMVFYGFKSKAKVENDKTYPEFTEKMVQTFTSCKTHIGFYWISINHRVYLCGREGELQFPQRLS